MMMLTSKTASILQIIMRCRFVRVRRFFGTTRAGSVCGRGESMVGESLSVKGSGMTSSDTHKNSKIHVFPQRYAIYLHKEISISLFRTFREPEAFLTQQTLLVFSFYCMELCQLLPILFIVTDRYGLYPQRRPERIWMLVQASISAPAFFGGAINRAPTEVGCEGD